MKKVNIEKDKLTFELGADQARELQSKIEQVVSEWGEYQKPKFEEAHNGFVINIDSALWKKVEEYIGKNNCKVCGRSFKEFCVVSQFTKFDPKTITFNPLCGRCLSACHKTITFLGDKKRRVMHLVKMPEPKKKLKIKGGKKHGKNET